MARKTQTESGFKRGPKKVTSIGNSRRTRPKHKKHTKKKGRGQGSGRK